ncbi:MAG TPA: matrixin family metalloprotease, partial [Caldilineaceae bacterium]|nr:matrixin family metalloprotease [Caldilineaceae bacterium]
SADHRLIESTVMIDVNYTVAGGSLARLTLVSEGGYLADQGLGMRSSHVATFAQNEQVLLFLRAKGDRLVLVDEESGKYRVANNLAANANEVDHSLTALATLYALVAAELQGRQRPLTLPADWASREPVENAVEAASLSEFVYEDLRWAGVDPQVHFVVNPFGPETGGPDGSAEDFLAALTNPARTWSIVPGAALGFLYNGPTSATDVAYNGVNEVIFFPAGQTSVAGRSRVWFDQDRTILEADFWLNSDLDWDTTGQPTNNELDVESAALHEFGHWLGLGHDTEPDAAMYSTLQTGSVRRTLHPSDIAGITYIYPCPVASCIPAVYADETPTPSATPSPTNSPAASATLADLPTITTTISPSPTPPLTLSPTATLSLTQPAPVTPTMAPTTGNPPGGDRRTFLPLVAGDR